jgi:hypothetical protein
MSAKAFLRRFRDCGGVLSWGTFRFPLETEISAILGKSSPWTLSIEQIKGTELALSPLRPRLRFARMDGNRVMANRLNGSLILG